MTLPKKRGQRSLVCMRQVLTLYQTQMKIFHKRKLHISMPYEYKYKNPQQSGSKFIKRVSLHDQVIFIPGMVGLTFA